MAIIGGVTRPEEFCGHIVTMLGGDARPDQVIANSAFADTIKSASNMAAFDIPEEPFAGKSTPTDVNPRVNNVPAIYVKYAKPLCAAGTSLPNRALCDVTGSTEHEFGYMQVPIGQIAERGFVMSMQDFNNFCEGPEERKVQTLRRKAFEIRQEINKAAISAAYLDADAYTDGVASIGTSAKALNVITGNGNALNADFAKIRREYRKAKFQGNRILTFGGDTVAMYQDVRALQGFGIGQGGINPEQIMNAPFVYDNSMDVVIEDILDANAQGKSHGLTLPEGYFGIFERYENTDYKQISLPNQIATTVEIEGWKYDMDLVWIECDKVWKIQLKKWYDFGSIPNAAYCDGQGLLFHWVFGCGDYSCDPGNA